ncbi:cystathionine beta-l [Violaceomyces palustris]|uniref:Cystathionine beta-l n=1 Tax=Violaceomyces palustris TaxID=1673888 RepID=A0ACD0NQH0_9BASI|nr:cystathionine beta-l [Violaceomyces palustris]
MSSVSGSSTNHSARTVTLGGASTMASSIASLDSSAPTSPSPSLIGEKGLFVSHKDRRGPNGYRFATQCATVEDPNHKDQYGSSSVPIYMTATFKGLPGAEFDYTRSGNPTRSMLQHHLCQLQNCRHSFAVSSGMACLDVITRLIKSGDRIIAGDDIYGGTQRLLGYLASHQGIHTDHVDTTDASKVEEALQKRARDYELGLCGKVSMLLLETPTNPLLKICDLERCARAAKRYAPDAIVVVDNTMMSPYLMRPLELGVDVVYDSGTKYLSGHHDLMAGVIACDRDDLGQRIAFTINSIGNALTPMDSFLLLRGIKTLAVRMDRQQASAMHVAHYLHSLGFQVNYPGLASHPSKDIHDRQAAGPGAVLSFETGDKMLSEKIVGATRLWGISVSFGCVNSLISMPCLMSHASIDPKIRAARRLPEDLIRLCVGIEDTRDLIEDLEAALLEAGAIRRKASLSSTPSVESSESLQSSRAGSPSPSPLPEYERVPLVAFAVDEPIADLVGGLDRAKIETRGGEGEGSKANISPPTSVIVSAPGKVILFGEHAVVHGVKAVAASVALRCFAHVSDREDGKLSLGLPDLGVEHVWKLDDLPWDVVPEKLRIGAEAELGAHEELDQGLIAAIEKCVGDVVNETDRSHAGSVAFLYLYMCIAGKEAARGQAFVLRSSLPIGAGLGSSAALSACLASSMAYTYGRLEVPSSAESGIPASDAILINSWAFLSEKVMHGNPSGVDNAVAVYGGAVAFTRAHPSNNLVGNELEKLGGFGSVRFLLTDTGVGRDTKSLVASVTAQKEKEPERVLAVLERIQKISDEAESLLSNHGVPRKDLLSRLGELVTINHQELVGLGVSHASLEAIRAKTQNERFKLSTKLTGAGGGGCAVTLLPDDFSEAKMKELELELSRDGFKCYETRVGGAGVGVLIPINEKEKDKKESEIPDRVVFEEAETKTLASWAEKAGEWIYA